MNAHSARFSARRKGSGEPKPQVFLKVLAQKSSNRRVSAEVATRNCSRTYAELCAVLNLIPEEPSYGDGGILYHGWGGGGFGGGSQWDLPLAEKGDGSAAVAAAKKMQPGDMPDFNDCLNVALNGGKGATPVEAIQIHRAVAARSPSLAIAMTMHNFSVATLVEYLFYGDYTVELLQQIAGGQLLVASGFAEGRAGTSILDPTMKATPVEGGFLLNGSKKPCSLSNSMHILTASVAVPSNNGNGGHRRAVAVVPADSEGIDRKPFWSSNVLRGLGGLREKRFDFGLMLEPVATKRANPILAALRRFDGVELAAQHKPLEILVHGDEAITLDPQDS